LDLAFFISMFIDEIKVFAQAGHGGKGCVAFHREAYRPKGGPSGGNGGRGGDVILEADHDLNNLIAQFYVPRLIAEKGKPGMGKGMDGSAGKDLVVKVPCGTLVWRLPSPPSGPSLQKEEQESSEPLPLASASRPVLRASGAEQAMEYELEKESEEPLAVQEGRPELVTDLTRHGERFILCKAGRGGLGNRNFATSTNQTPRFAQPGEPGEEGYFLLELRIMADVGLVGFPNAGKSTLLAAISHARPKIAPYPFTTLHPQIGILEYPDYHRLTVCDVPGLIAGAHENAGLGHSFLRHIQRCSMLVLLLDMAGMDGRRPGDDYRQLLTELELYHPGLLAKPRLVVANKMDEPAAADNLAEFRREEAGIEVLPISAGLGEGLEEFKDRIRRMVQEIPPLEDRAG
jgi:GTPase